MRRIHADYGCVDLVSRPTHPPARASRLMPRSSTARLVLLSIDSACPRPPGLRRRSQFSAHRILVLWRLPPPSLLPSQSWILRLERRSGRVSLYSEYKGHIEDRREDRRPVIAHFQQRRRVRVTIRPTNLAEPNEEVVDLFVELGWEPRL
jgi:hypothetical protein